jgi:hypothetical protein
MNLNSNFLALAVLKPVNARSLESFPAARVRGQARQASLQKFAATYSRRTEVIPSVLFLPHLIAEISFASL